MNNRKLIVAILVITSCLVVFLSTALAQSATPSATAPSAAAKRVRQLWLSMDSSLFDEVKELAEKYPTDLELNGWYVALHTWESTDDIIAEMKKTAPDSPWTILASTVAVEGDEEKALVDKAIEKGKGDEGVLLLATELMKRLASREEKADSLQAFLSAHDAEYEKSADSLMSKAGVIETLSELKGSSNTDAVMELANRTLALDSKHVPAIMVKSRLLTAQQKQKENYELLKSAVQTQPSIYSLHEKYWKAVMLLPNSKAEEKQKEVAADVKEFLLRKQPTVSTVRATLRTLEDLTPELETSIGDLILKQYPDSASSDAVLFVRAIKDLPLATKDENTLAQIKALETFIDRPKHYDEGLLKRANNILADLYAEQEKPDVERFYKAIAAGDRYPSLFISLANRKAHLPELESMALEELDKQWTRLKSGVGRIPDKQVKGVVTGMIGYYVAQWQDVLGWIYFQQGKLKQAEGKLELAVKLNPNDAQTTVHLGQLYETKGDLAKAEQLYSDSLGKSFEDDGEHPAVALLRELYKRKHGNSVSLEAYMKPILEKGREIRKRKILSKRVAEPKQMPNFSLATLKGETVTSESLKGKILVINFWATWCGPCRAEMPDIQKFYDKYKNDPNVVFLSMSIDEAETQNEKVQEYLTKNKYTFPVLRAHEYGKQNGINGVPETWFVDANGNRVFEGIAGSKELVEEFIWRIESMRASIKNTASK